jgi:hypothetical protein
MNAAPGSGDIGFELSDEDKPINNPFSLEMQEQLS